MIDAKRLIDIPDDQAHLFDTFSEELVATIESCFDVVGKEHSARAWKEKALVNFHRLRLNKIPAICTSLYSQVGLKNDDPLLLQSVSQEVFNTLIVHRMNSRIPSAVAPSHAEPLDKDEENALQYASGYIPLKLLKKHSKHTDEKASNFVTCLKSMAVEEDQYKDTFEDYTREWIEQVDHGGLFQINDCTFNFFKAVECQVRKRLPALLKSQHGVSKESLISATISDEEVEFFWTLLSVMKNMLLNF